MPPELNMLVHPFLHWAPLMCDNVEGVDLSEAEDNVVIGVVTVLHCRRPVTTIFSNGIQEWGV